MEQRNPVKKTMVITWNALYAWEAKKTARIFFLVPLCQDDMELTIHPVSGDDLGDVLLGFNLEGWPQKEERGSILAVLWAIWLHKKDKLFRGRAASNDGAAYAVEGLVPACKYV